MRNAQITSYFPLPMRLRAPSSEEGSAKDLHIRHDVFCAPRSPQGDWPPEGAQVGEEISSGHDPPESPLNYDPDEQLSGEFDY
jgi:hypothetical protein